MLFLAFQDFITFYTTKDVTTLDEQAFFYYLRLYQSFCKEHHIMDNVYDVVKET